MPRGFNSTRQERKFCLIEFQVVSGSGTKFSWIVFRGKKWEVNKLPGSASTIKPSPSPSSIKNPARRAGSNTRRSLFSSKDTMSFSLDKRRERQTSVSRRVKRKGKWRGKEILSIVKRLEVAQCSSGNAKKMKRT